MGKNNSKKLLDEIKEENKKAVGFLKAVDQKIADIDKRYAQAIVKDELNTVRNYKKILERESANN